MARTSTTKRLLLAVLILLLPGSVRAQTGPVFPVGGDLSGNSPNPSVAGIQSHALPALTTGFLNWSGAAWQYSAGAVAPGSNDTLYETNHTGSVDFFAPIGDLSFLSHAFTVTGLKGVALPSLAAGALYYNGSAWVLGVLPVGDLPSGSPDWTGSVTSNTVVQAQNGAVVFNAGGSIVSGSGTASGTGAFRVANNILIAAARNAGNTADVQAIGVDASNNVYLGGPGSGNVFMRPGGTTGIWTVGPTTAVLNSAATLQLSYLNAGVVQSNGAGLLSSSTIVPGSLTPGSNDQLLDTSHTGSSEWFTLGGDATFASHNLTIAGLLGHALPSIANGALYYNGTWNLGTIPVLDLPNLLGDATGPITSNTVTQAQNGAEVFGAGSGWIQIGGTTSSTGSIRNASGTSMLTFRNAANTADVVALNSNGSDQIGVGGTNSGSLLMRPAGTTIATFSTTGLTLATPGTLTVTALGAGVAQTNGAGTFSSSLLAPSLLSLGTADQLIDTNHGVTTGEWFTLGGDGSFASHNLTNLSAQNGAVVFGSGGTIQLGASGTSTTGRIMTANNVVIATARNATASADITVLGTDASNNVYLGGQNGSDTFVRAGGGAGGATPYLRTSQVTTPGGASQTGSWTISRRAEGTNYTVDTASTTIGDHLIGATVGGWTLTLPSATVSGREICLSAQGNASLASPITVTGILGTETFDAGPTSTNVYGANWAGCWVSNGTNWFTE